MIKKIFLYLLLFSSLAYGVEFMPPVLRGGEALQLRFEPALFIAYDVSFNETSYKPYKNGNNMEIILPLDIEDFGKKNIVVNKKIWKLNLKSEVHTIDVVKRKVRLYKLKKTDQKMRSVQPHVKEHRELISKTLKIQSMQRLWQEQFILPVDSKITSEFAVKRQGGKYSYYHMGIDLRGKKGTPVYAANAGKAALAKENLNVYGSSIIIDHGQGVVSMYNHLNKIFVKEGDVVHKGQLIAEVGSSGWSTGPHLHFGIYVQGKAVDPAWWIDFSKDAGI